eukprot:TRINITY_DN1880_c0_g1_i3.p2 TRINITY_DN1880_c0_g1~~TRINITY_DN1880_c0_g1_i3.p2  ORF type:complete len:200 (-),score=37.92 TRINITY_DN1880_c0_g1_i3:230-829(-)
MEHSDPHRTTATTETSGRRRLRLGIGLGALSEKEIVREIGRRRPAVEREAERVSARDQVCRSGALSAVFDEFDVKESGELNSDDLRLLRLGLEQWTKEGKWTSAMKQGLLDRLNQDGPMTRQDFCTYLQDKMPPNPIQFEGAVDELMQHASEFRKARRVNERRWSSARAVVAKPPTRRTRHRRKSVENDDKVRSVRFAC